MADARRLIVWGASGHAKVVADIARLTGWEVAGFLDDVTPSRRGEAFFGATVLGTFDVVSAAGLLDGAVLALGVGDNGARLEMASRMLARGLELPPLVHPSAVIASSASLDAGVVLVAGALVNPDARLGVAALVNTGASVDHDCILGPGAHVAPHAALAGTVRMGQRSLAGMGALVLPRVVIGRDVTIGAGSTVTRDVPDGVIVVGTPARITPRSEPAAG